MIALQGTGVSTGIASGKIRFFKRKTADINDSKVSDPASEFEKYQKALAITDSQLEQLEEKARNEVGDEAASLFEAHRLMLADLDFQDMIEASIKENRLNAAAAVFAAGNSFAEMFASMDDEYMRARSTDIKDISTRLISVLNDSSDTVFSCDEPFILASDDLTPSETVQLDKKLVLGFLLSAGSADSHTAILARTLGIPAIINLGDSLKESLENRPTIIDGSVGYVVVDPDDTTREYLQKKQKDENAVLRMLEQLKGQPDETLDGRQIKLFANITSPADIDAVVKNDARGIGLFRSEFLYLRNESAAPSEDEQFEAYKSVVSRMNGQRVIIRTLDIGADKQVPYLDLEKEENPALGLRAIRLCLTRPELFKTQLRALYRASAYGTLSIMFPMIASLWEVQEAKRICEAVQKELKSEQIPFSENVELGIMIETPAAVMIAPELAREVSFFSIGTNDLTQYTLAIDRQSVKGMDRFFDTKHPAVMRLIKMTVDAAHGAGIWAGICGELASNPQLTSDFLKIGVDELSVSPRFILPLRNTIRQIGLS